MEKRSRLNMKRGIRRSLLTTDKTEFREIVMTSKVIDKNYIENFFKFNVNLIIYKYGIISSDILSTIIKIQKRKMKWILRQSKNMNINLFVKVVRSQKSHLIKRKLSKHTFKSINKSKAISRSLKISRERVYKTVEKIKQVLINSKLNSNSAAVYRP